MCIDVVWESGKKTSNKCPRPRDGITDTNNKSTVILTVTHLIGVSNQKLSKKTVTDFES